MSCIFSKTVLFLTAALVVAPSLASAQTPPQTATVPTSDATLPTDAAELKKQIESFDPRAVTAAKSYFAQPNVKGVLIAVTDNVYQQVLTIVEKQNPSLDNTQMTKVEATVGDPLKKRLDLVVQMNILAALKTFSTDELVALDKFYSSAEGKSIQAKMPRLMSAVPVIVKSIMPDYLDEVKTKLKADKVEVDF